MIRPTCENIEELAKVYNTHPDKQRNLRRYHDTDSSASETAAQKQPILFAGER
jgi:hypothetical protein